MNNTLDLITVLVEERQRRGWSLQRLADEVGTGKTSVWEWENATMPTLLNFVAWANALGFEVDVRSKQAQHTLVQLIVERPTFATYLCSCGADGTATCADHLTDYVNVKQRAIKNHELHQVRALRDGR
jgi:transcriptional regulator with XRE-family HTH domain